MPNDTNRDSSQRSDGLEQVAARIADEQPVNWLSVDETTDVVSVSGLREIEQLAQGFRHMQVSAVAPKTPSSNRFRFGALQVLEPLGSGAQGEVWRAYDPLLDLQVALKLRKVDSDTLSHQFLEEARRLARVRQANILSVYGAAVHDGRAGLWTELVRGSPLSELLTQHGPFPADEVRGIGLDLCHALAAVHRHGVVHGDVKAANVMREVSGRIVLRDFGASREFDAADARRKCCAAPRRRQPAICMRSACFCSICSAVPIRTPAASSKNCSTCRSAGSACASSISSPACRRI
jgi:serine/threonine protein kinase